MPEEMTGRTPVPTSITRRRLVAGAAALGAVSLAGARMAQAQESTATPGIDGADSTDATETTVQANETAEAYQLFVAKLAVSLGVADQATVDTGIRDALKAMVDEQLTSGEISANFATERKAEIDASEAPLRIGTGERGGGHRPGFGSGAGDSRGNGNGPKPGMAPGADTDSPETTGTPEATGATIA